LPRINTVAAAPVKVESAGPATTHSDRRARHRDHETKSTCRSAFSSIQRHREKRSDEAIQGANRGALCALDGFAPLTMTTRAIPTNLNLL
jgi:hypothetical protein